MEKSSFHTKATGRVEVDAPVERPFSQSLTVEGGPRTRKARAPSHRALANLVKGARAGGFVPYEIVLETTGEIRLMAERSAAAPVGRANDFDPEFG